MNYQNIYRALIERARSRKINGYVERHHVIPRCMGGSDDVENLVPLTAREHFLAHLLLVKIYPGNLKLVKAVAMMCVGHKEHRYNNRLYGRARELFGQAMSEAQGGEKNSQFGSRWTWISNLETHETIKVKPDFNFDYPWVKGIRVWEQQERKLDAERVKEQKRQDKIKNSLTALEETVNAYRESGSLRIVAELMNISHIAVRNRIKKYESLSQTIVLKAQGK